MKDDNKIIHGGGNVFRELGLPNPEAEHSKAILAAKIISELDKQNVTVRGAYETTGFAAADFPCVRQAKLSRFTIDRLMAILDRLDQDVEMTVNVQPRSKGLPKMPMAA